MKRSCAAALLPFLAANMAPADVVREEDIRAHVSVLASDSFEGRAPGTEGGNRAVAYIARQLRDAGIEPGAASGWYQPVALIDRAPAGSRTTFARNGRRIAIEPDEVILRSIDPASEVRAAPVLYLGLGIAKDMIDPRGSIALILIDSPAGTPGYPARREALLRRGAAAVIGIVGEASFADHARRFTRRSTLRASRTVEGIEGAMSIDAASRIMHAAGLDIATLAAASADPAYRGQPLGIAADLEVTNAATRYDSHNVIGRIAGSDPDAGAVVLMAHWDHLGLCRPEGVLDRICNGAIDNASGVALLIEVAKRLAAGPRARRSIYFVATTAEERGLLGARAFAEDPPVPLDTIHAVLNADTVAVAGAGAPLAVIGGTPGMTPLIEKAAEIAGRTIDADREADAFLKRQDGWAFSEKGVPAAMITGSFSDMERLNRFLSSDYHGPGDELTAASDLSGAAADAGFHVVLARLLADPGQYSR